jgi:hypothetical protein
MSKITSTAAPASAWTRAYRECGTPPSLRQVVEYEGRQDRFYIAPGVAVIADDTWAALKGAEALSAEWDGGPNADASTETLEAQLHELAKNPGEVIRDDGDVTNVFRGASQIVEAAFEIPFLAHATMEPMNCTIRVDKDACEIWSPTQNPQPYTSRSSAAGSAADSTPIPNSKPRESRVRSKVPSR